MAVITLRNLVDGGADRADTPSPAELDEDEFFPWSACVRAANDGLNKLWRVATSFKKALYYRTANYTISSPTYSSTLPDDFAKALFVEVWPDTPRRMQVGRVDLQAKDSWFFTGYPYPFMLDTRRGYTILGANGDSSVIQFQPQENAAASYRLYYIPEPTLFDATDEDSFLDPELCPYDTYIKAYIGRAMALKEESFEVVKACDGEMLAIENELRDALDIDEAGPSTIQDIYE